VERSIRKEGIRMFEKYHKFRNDPPLRVVIFAGLTLVVPALLGVFLIGYLTYISQEFINWGLIRGLALNSLLGAAILVLSFVIGLLLLENAPQFFTRPSWVKKLLSLKLKREHFKVQG
jgi:hypothetical protein